MPTLKFIFILFCFLSIGFKNVSVGKEINLAIENSLQTLIDCPDTLGIYAMTSAGEISITVDTQNFPTLDSCGLLQYRLWYSYLDSSNYPDQLVDWQLPADSTASDSVLKYLPRYATFYCEALWGKLISTFDVRIYKVDEKGNWDYCESVIIIVDSFLVCDNVHPARIGGVIKSYDDRPMLGVDMKMVGGPFMSFCWNRLTDVSGEFGFRVHPEYQWQVSGMKDDNYLNGVTANDLSLLARHIAGIELLNNPFKILAGDANGDLDIDIRDILVLRKLLLGITEEIEEIPPWRFIDAEYDFIGMTDISLPQAARDAEIIRFEPILGWELETHFIGVKIGDLDGDAEILD